MNYQQILYQAWINILAAKLRSFLAILGILVGTASVVALLSAGKLATEHALAQFKTLGTDLLSVTVFPKPQQHSSKTTPYISAQIWQDLARHVPEIRQIAPYAQVYQNASYQGYALDAPIIGAEESLADIIHIRLDAGYFVSYMEIYEHFCVIGSRLAEKLKAIRYVNPIGKQLKIGQSLFTIIGIAKPWTENGFFTEDINQAVIVPIGAIALINQEANINHAIMRIDEHFPIDSIIERIKAYIAQYDPKLNVYVRSAKQIINSLESQGQTFTTLLAVIGGVSLLVGGIGIMNVMLVSISERKKEIGIRKAIGAKRRDIQLLFLMESLLLAVLGGMLGLMLGVLFSWLVAYINHWTFAILVFPMFIGFMVSIITGIFFGFYPAYRAAKLNPVVILRTDN